MVPTGSSHGLALLLAIFLPQRAALSPFIHLSEFPGPALCAEGYNIRWLLRMIRKKGICLYLALIKLLGLRGLIAKIQATNQIEQFKRSQLTALAA